MGIKVAITSLLLLFFVVAQELIIQQVTTLKLLDVEMYVDPLPQLAKIDAVANPQLTIGMYMTTQKFHRDLPETTIFGYGVSQETAAFPGPVIETNRFIPTYVTWENHLPLTHILPWDISLAGAHPLRGGIPTVVHLHGATVAPADDGHALAWYTANYTHVGPAFDPSHTTYHYPNVQHGGNLIYHDHAIGMTRINLLAGLFGAYIIGEPLVEAKLNLPSGEEFDRHLIIADRRFNSNGSLYMNPVGDIPSLHPSWNPEYYGDANTVNGKVWPYLNVQRRKYRFRIINASNARFYNLSFVATASKVTYNVTVVGSDTSYLPTPVSTDEILLTIAETFDVVFDFSLVPDNEIELLNFAPTPYPGAFLGECITGPLTKVMKFIIDPLPPTNPDTSTVPAVLSNYPPALQSQATTSRYLAFYKHTDVFGRAMNFLINGKRFTDPMTETPRNGSTEVWNVINLTNDTHPFHIHLVHAQMLGARQVLNLAAFSACMEHTHDPFLCNLKVGDMRLPFIYDRTWKSIIKLPPRYMTSIVVKFSMVSGDPFPFDPTATPGYIYHCHILDHEDNQMIRPLMILP